MSALSNSTASSTTVSSLSTSPTDYTPIEEKWQRKEGPPYYYYQHYRLPSQDHASEVTLKKSMVQETNQSGFDMITHDPASSKEQQATEPKPGVPHTTSMQQLLNELSYLGGMINHR
jgi:hypothetical protein